MWGNRHLLCGLNLTEKYFVRMSGTAGSTSGAAHNHVKFSETTNKYLLSFSVLLLLGVRARSLARHTLVLMAYRKRGMCVYIHFMCRHSVDMTHYKSSRQIYLIHCADCRRKNINFRHGRVCVRAIIIGCVASSKGWRRDAVLHAYKSSWNKLIKEKQRDAENGTQKATEMDMQKWNSFTFPLFISV